jgi:iron complex outermembrane receptor protein
MRDAGTLKGLLAVALLGSAAHADERDLADLSLAELMDVPVTSVSKKETRLGDAPTAITVITPDDLRRLGITSIAEALRLAPGFDVARTDSSHWAISARGFNYQYANTLLVLIDGRSVYTPTFGGVYWDSQDLTLSDIERIEVIRGPGATLWGANAVNGVVNVITRHAKDTQGLMLSAAAGNADLSSLDARYGGEIGSNVHYRTYAKYFEREGLDIVGSGTSDPNWHSTRAGFRADWEPAEDKEVTLQGDYYDVRSPVLGTYVTVTPPFTAPLEQNEQSTGFDVLGRWTKALSDVSHVSVQAYVDSYSRLQESRDTADIQLEHRFRLASRHDVVWGLGYRFSSDDVHLDPVSVANPRKANLNLYTAFLQDEVTVIPERVHITGGAKLEHNDFTGLEVQPSLRATWTPADGHTLWGSVSRSVSTPSRFYHDTRFNIAAFPLPDGTVVELAYVPRKDLPSQKLNAFEVGYRASFDTRLSLDLAAFYNRYRDLYGLAPEPAQFELEPAPHILLAQSWAAVERATSYGTELSVNYRVGDSWRLTGTHTWLHMRSTIGDTIDKLSPDHQFSLRSYSSLTSHLEFNAAVYWASAVNALAISESLRVPAYWRVDAGLIYTPLPSLEIGMWGQNLTDRVHVEGASQDSGATHEISRSVLVRVTKKF